MLPASNLAEQLFIAPAQREAWLRPRFAALYPAIPPGVWVTAFSAAWAIEGGIMAGARVRAGPGPRVLLEKHFVFRGGGGPAPRPKKVGLRLYDP
jgi:hypothetical protein